MTINRSCPACDGTKSRSWGTKDSHELVRCARCSTLYTALTPSGESLHSLYTDYYDEVNLTIPEFVTQRLDEIVGGFAVYRQSGRLLDVGFGAATLLEAARRAGWAATGTELAEGAVARARNHGFDVFLGTLQEASYPDASFDVVTIVEVLEHLLDPASLLREVRRVLRSGGLLWVTTPHGGGLSARLLGPDWSVVAPPEHIQLFSTEGLRRLLHRTGFVRVRIAAHGVNPYEIIQHFRKGEAMNGRGRVVSSYKVNAFFTESPSRRVVKAALNGFLSTVRLGDSLKAHAVASQEGWGGPANHLME
jgi:SAM-dependent methyltransferase